MKYFGISGFLSIALFAAFTSVAQAQEAYTAKSVNLRAGPAREYPLVAVLPRGYHLSVLGCLSNYTWCDVLAGSERGWVYAANINYPYQNTYEPVLGYGSLLGIAIIGFVVGDYWNNHYRDRPWYPDRQHWINRAPIPSHQPHFAPPDRNRNIPQNRPGTPPPQYRGGVPGEQHPQRRPDQGYGQRRPLEQHRNQQNMMPRNHAPQRNDRGSGGAQQDRGARGPQNR